MFIHIPTAGLCLPSDHPPSRHWVSACALGATGSHLYPAPLGSARWVHRSGLTDSRGSHLLGYPMFRLCLPSPCACIISQAVGLVKYFQKLFSGLPSHGVGGYQCHASVTAPSRSACAYFIVRFEPSRPARRDLGSPWEPPPSMILLYHVLVSLSTLF